MHAYKNCILYDRKCVECGECDWCDMYPEKICDNCQKCLRLDSDYLAIRIDGLLTSDEAIGEEDTAGV